MSTSFLATLAVFALLPFGHPKPAVDHAYAVGRWRLDVHQDTFRHEVQCRIGDDYGHFPKVTAEPQALILKLPGHADGSTAWFSVDGAPPRPWRDVEAVLIADGAMTQAESLDNETGGVLPLPYVAVDRARNITVEMSRGGRTTQYSLAGLWPLVTAAARLGCRFRGAG